MIDMMIGKLLPDITRLSFFFDSDSIARGGKSESFASSPSS